MPRKKSYAVLMTEIDRLKTQAEAIKRQEAQGVIQRIREAIRHYDLKPADVFGDRGAGKAHSKPNGKVRGRPVKYRDDAGNTWIGIGKRPTWLHQALAKGKTLDDFRV